MGKKKKKTTGKKQSRAQSAASNADAADKPQVLDRDGKEFYETQKRDVQRRVEWLQRRCDELEILNEKLQKNRDSVNEDMKEIKEYLKGRVSEKTETCTELQEELKALQEAYESEQRMYKLAEEKLEKEFKDTKEQLSNEGLFTLGKLGALEDCRVAKEEMNEKFKEMEEKIQRQQEMHREEIYQLERQTVVQKDSLRKEMLERVDNVAAEFRKVSNRQMAETTQKTIEENAVLNRQLATLSEKITYLIAENDSLKATEKGLQREIEVLSELDKEMLANTNKSIKVIKSLADECRDQDTQLIDMEERAEEAGAVQSEHALLTQQTQSQEEELQAMRAEVCGQQSRLAQTAELVRSEARVHRRFRRLLRQSEQAVSDSYATLTPDEEMTESEAIILRRKMLISLLELLNLAARVGLGPEPGSLGRARQPDRYEHRPLAGASGRQQQASRSRASGSGGEFVSGRLSELGLTPSAKQSGIGDTPRGRTQFVAEKLATQLPPGALLQPIGQRTGAGRTRAVPPGIF